jgi:hypothetical protein
MNIKPYHPDNQQAVINLWQACNLVVAWNDPVKDIQRKMLVDPDLFLIGELSEDIVATVMGGYEGHRGWKITSLSRQNINVKATPEP